MPSLVILQNFERGKTYGPDNRSSGRNNWSGGTGSRIITNKVSRKSDFEILNTLNILDLLVSQMDLEGFDVGF